MNFPREVLYFTRLAAASDDLFSSIWKSFIPFPSYQVFQRGAYYSVEVIPDAIAIISLNTMYFYDSNKGTFGPPIAGYSDDGGAEQRSVAASSRILMIPVILNLTGWRYSWSPSELVICRYLKHN